MFKFGIGALIGIVIYVQLASCTGNETFLDTAADLVYHFPNYLEDAVNFEIEQEEKTDNNKWLYLFARGQCLRDFLHVFGALRKKSLWAIQVFDTWGKLPSGILSGNMYDFGDFDGCIKIDSPEFVPQYCIARLSKEELVMPNPKKFIANDLDALKSLLTDFRGHKFAKSDNGNQQRIMPTKSNMLGLNFGICIPDSCSEEKVGDLLSTIQKRLFRDNAVIQLVPDTCQNKQDQQWNFRAGDYVVLSFLLFLAFIMIASTIYDIIQTKRDREKSLILIAFSMYTNGQKLFAIKRTKCEYTMDCLTGIRLFSALWVMYAHSHVMVILAPIFNFAYIPEWTELYTTAIILMGPFSVDSFLFMSGLLVTWSLLKHLNKTNGKVNYVMLYVHRILRLTPVLAVLVIISVTIFKRFGGGPLWFSFMNNAVNCDDYWWSALLYIQNYNNPDTICLTHSWYLSVDMQLFLFAPPIGYLLYRFGYFVIAALAVLVVVCVGWTYYLFSHFALINQLFNLENDILQTFRLTYYATHIRMSPWLIGIMFAYFLYKDHGKRVKWNKSRIALHWIVTLVLFGLLAYYTFELQQIDHKATSVESGLYTPFSRIGWSLFLCLLIYACVKGYGGPVNWFLSLPVWQPLARLSYAIYLVHMPIQLIVAGNTHRPLHFSGLNVLLKFFGDFMISLFASIFLSLALESPIVALEKFLFSTKKKLVIPTTQREEPTAPANSS